MKSLSYRLGGGQNITDRNGSKIGVPNLALGKTGCPEFYSSAHLISIGSVGFYFRPYRNRAPQ